MKLTIIVPVYNASLYLHRCVDSLLAQGLLEGDYEIILINDGSKDSSLGICEDYAAKYPQIIRVLNHENQGVAFTRNRGIKAAQGEYICFVDSDDYLIPGGYRYLIDTYLDESLDILSFWALTLDKKMKANYIEKNEVSGKICYETNGRDFLCKHVQTFIVTSLFKRTFIMENHLFFTKLTIGEDVLFSVEAYLKNPKIRMVSSRIYRYDMNVNSAIHQRNYASVRKAVESYLFLLDSIHQFAEDNADDSCLKVGLLNIIEGQFVPFMSRILSSDLTIKEFRHIQEHFKQKDILPLKGKGKASKLINGIFSFPYAIRLYQCLYQRIFLPFIYPNVSRN